MQLSKNLGNLQHRQGCSGNLQQGLICTYHSCDRYKCDDLQTIRQTMFSRAIYTSSGLQNRKMNIRISPLRAGDKCRFVDKDKTSKLHSLQVLFGTFMGVWC